MLASWFAALQSQLLRCQLSCTLTTLQPAAAALAHCMHAPCGRRQLLLPQRMHPCCSCCRSACKLLLILLLLSVLRLLLLSALRLLLLLT